MRVLYIAGTGRSGSTLLSRALGQLDGFVAVGELLHLWRHAAPSDWQSGLCGCGRVYARCPFWSRVAQRLSDETPESELAAVEELRRRVDRVRYLPLMLGPWAPPGYRRRLALYRRRVLALYRAAAEVSGARVLVDESKDVSSLLLLSQLPDLEVTVVQLVRDPRGVAHSWHKRKRQATAPGDELMPRRSPLSTAVYWSYSHLLAEWAGRRHAARIVLRYEEFVADPATAVGRILEAVGESPPPTYPGRLTAAEIDLPRVTHVLGGNPSKLAPGPLRLRLDEAWRRELAPAHRWLVQAVTAPLLRRYGYRRAPSSGSEPGRGPTPRARR